MRVSALTMYPVSTAAPRVRLAEHIPGLAREGVDLKLRATLSPQDYAVMASPGAMISKARLAGKAARRLRGLKRAEAELTLVHRLATPTPVPGLEPLRKVDIYDFDDALHLGAVGAANRRFGAVKQEPARWADYVRRARLVIAGNPYLADAAASLANRVEIVPSCVDPERQPLRQHRDASRVVIGWIGSPHTADYLLPVLAAVRRVRESGIDLVMRVIGARIVDPPSWLSFRPWTLETQASELASFDLGVMPLPDDPWTRGKCGYKLLQYFAAGVPAVCSPVGVNVKIAREGRGLTATSSEEWQRCLTQLAGSADERRERGLAGRRHVEECYSHRVWSPRLAELMKGLRD